MYGTYFAGLLRGSNETYIYIYIYIYLEIYGLIYIMKKEYVLVYNSRMN